MVNVDRYHLELPKMRIPLVAPAVRLAPRTFLSASRSARFVIPTPRSARWAWIPHIMRWFLPMKIFSISSFTTERPIHRRQR